MSALAQDLLSSAASRRCPRTLDVAEDRLRELGYSLRRDGGELLVELPRDVVGCSAETFLRLADGSMCQRGMRLAINDGAYEGMAIHVLDIDWLAGRVWFQPPLVGGRIGWMSLEAAREVMRGAHELPR